MAELALKIDDGSGYEDRDVICAFNRRRIRRVHAEHLTSPNLFGFTIEGLRPAGSLARQSLEHTRQYRFDRLSKFVIRRTNLRDGTTEELSDKPNAKGEYIDVPLFLERRLKHPRHSIFGLKGREFWFGGKTYTDHPDLDKVWQEIEARTTERESSYTLWPAGSDDLKVHLFVSVVEFSDAEAEALTAPWIDETDPENPVTVKKRNMSADWRSPAVLALLKVSVKDIEDRGKSVDVRRNVEAISNVLFLWNKRDQTTGKRLK